MKDRDFLIWIHERLTNVYKEDPITDYMHKLRAIIKSTPIDKDSKWGMSNNIQQLLKELEHDSTTEDVRPTGRRYTIS